MLEVSKKSTWFLFPVGPPHKAGNETALGEEEMCWGGNTCERYKGKERYKGRASDQDAAPKKSSPTQWEALGPRLPIKRVPHWAEMTRS